MKKKLFKFTIEHLLAAELLLGIIANIGSILLLVYITKHVLKNEVGWYDLTISQYIYSLRNRWLTWIMTFVTNLGGAETMFMVTAFTAAILLYKNYKKQALIFILSLAMGGLLNILFKAIFQVPRPQIAPLIAESNYSYPSGHAMNNFVFYGLLVFYTYHFTRNKVFSLLAFVAAAILVLLIGFSRVYLGVHYPSDIAGGYVAGFWWLATLMTVDKTMELRKELKD